MSQPYLGEIRLFAGTYAPRGWAFCHGQTLSVSQHSALFSLLDARYGGNGETTFALPDLRGRVPIHQGQGVGLSNRGLGDMGGSEAVTLLPNQVPPHTHAVRASSATATSRTAVGNAPAALPANGSAYSSATPATTLEQTSAAGGSQPHENVQPYLGINYIIALEGNYPPRS